MAEQLPAFAVILAGGRGTRFWPLSRRRKPKQFLALTSDASLLEQTYGRLRGLFPRQRILVVTTREQAALVRRHLPELPRGNLLVEPVGRNTAASIALAAAHIRQRAAEALLGVFPADHAIADVARFRHLVRAALTAAAADPCTIVLGIPPREPHTGYGYIERGRYLKRIGGTRVYRVRRFAEKPDRATARRYLRSRRYFWNSGMFFWKLSTFEKLLARLLPATARTMERLSPAVGARAYARTLARLYPRLPNISVDYALLERAPDVRMLPADIGWNDLGSWAALYDYLASRPGDNVARTQVLALDARGNLLWTAKKFAAAVGVSDLVVVETPDALLVTSRERAQDVGKVVEYLETKAGRDLL
jgi:mannose-1-phosphate guanylyltransferase